MDRHGFPGAMWNDDAPILRAHDRATTLEKVSKRSRKSAYAAFGATCAAFRLRTRGKNSTAAMPVDLAMHRQIQSVREPIRVSSSALAGPGACNEGVHCLAPMSVKQAWRRRTAHSIARDRDRFGHDLVSSHARCVLCSSGLPAVETRPRFNAAVSADGLIGWMLRARRTCVVGQDA